MRGARIALVLQIPGRRCKLRAYIGSRFTPRLSRRTEAVAAVGRPSRVAICLPREKLSWAAWVNSRPIGLGCFGPAPGAGARVFTAERAVTVEGSRASALDAVAAGFSARSVPPVSPPSRCRNSGIIGRGHELEDMQMTDCCFSDCTVLNGDLVRVPSKITSRRDHFDSNVRGASCSDIEILRNSFVGMMLAA